MANPIPDEDKLYQILNDERVKVHPIIWQLLDHHIRNDLNAISMLAGDIFDRQGSITQKEIDSMISRIINISSLLKKLQKATGWDGKYYDRISFPDNNKE